MPNNFSKFIQRFGLPIGLLVLVLLLQLIYFDVPLLSPLNVKNILLETVSISLTALGLSFIMMSGEGDLSFAGMFSLLTVIFAMVSNTYNNFALSYLVVTGIAMGVNLIIALFVTQFNFSSFIVSIAVMFMANGVEKALHQQTTLIENPAIQNFSRIEFGLPLVVWLMIALYILAYLVINKTKYGFSLRIVGEKKEAAIEAGINNKVMKISAYLIAGFLLALASSIESTRVGAIYEQGKFYMLPVFAACFLGSSMFVQGRINVAGTLVGALFMGILEKFMNMISVESYMVSLTQGFVLLVSVGLVAFKNRDKIDQINL